MDEYAEVSLPTEEEKAAFLQWVEQMRAAAESVSAAETLNAQLVEARALASARVQNFRELSALNGVSVDPYGWYNFLTPVDRSRIMQTYSFY